MRSLLALQLYEFGLQVLGALALGLYFANFLWWLTHRCYFCEKRYRLSKSDSNYRHLFCSWKCQQCDERVPNNPFSVEAMR